MENIENQLSELRNQYSAQLTDAEENFRRLQAQIGEWRSKIAAIDTLLRQAEVDDEGDASESLLEFNATEEMDEEFTPVQAYWRPILQVLVELGGRARRRQVVDLVGEKMKGILKEADRGRLPKTGVIRWRNRVAWQSTNMSNEGLMTKGAERRGVWEITEAGRKWLQRSS